MPASARWSETSAGMAGMEPRMNAASRADNASHSVWFLTPATEAARGLKDEGRGGIQGAGHEVDGDTAMSCRKGEITRVGTM
jgi:hypothetical protein